MTYKRSTKEEIIKRNMRAYLGTEEEEEKNKEIYKKWEEKKGGIN